MAKAAESFHLDDKVVTAGDDVTDADKKRLEGMELGHLVVSDADYKKLVAEQDKGNETTDDDEE